MGETAHEISSIRESWRSYPPGRTLPPAGPTRTLDKLGYSGNDVLPMVRPLPGLWPSRSRGSYQRSPSGVEPDPGRRPPPDCGPGLWTSLSSGPGVGRDLHRRAKGYLVSEASVYRLLKAHDLITSPAFVVIKAANASRNRHGAEPAVADRLHLPQGRRLGLDLSVDHPRRLLPLLIAWKLCTTKMR